MYSEEMATTLETIKVRKGGQLIKATIGAAAYDLHSTEYAIIEPGNIGIINTGVSMGIPVGTVGMVCSRSGLAAKKGIFILNAPGIIDSDYRGEVMVILANFGDEILTIEPDDRIGQLLFMDLCKSKLEFVPELSVTTRGEGGLGSTGM